MGNELLDASEFSQSNITLMGAFTASSKKGILRYMGIEYQETFAHVAMLNTAHVLLSIATNLD